MAVRRFEVYRVSLDPTPGKEIKKKRPCLVISPDEMNHFIATVIVAPLTTRGTIILQEYLVAFKAKMVKSFSIKYAPLISPA